MSAVDLLQIRLKSHFYSEDRDSFLHEEETYDKWTMLTCEYGEFRYRVMEQSGEARPGDIVLCPPGVALHRQGLSRLSFHFAVFDLQAFFNGKPVDIPYRGKLVYRQYARLSSTLGQLRTALKHVSMRYTEHLVTDILYQYIEEQAALREERVPDDPSIGRAIRFIQNHVCEEVYMKEVAAHVGLSQSQFTRKFQKETGISPVQYLTRLRLQKARSLLVDTDLTLEKIADQCGYQTAFYLSRVFSREMGMSPSHYRSIHRV